MQTPPDTLVALLPFLFMVIFIPAALLLTVLPFWFICKKA
jgi:hypothetical protein